MKTQSTRLSRRINNAGPLRSHSFNNLEQELSEGTFKDASKHFGIDITTQWEDVKMHAPEPLRALFMEDLRGNEGLKFSSIDKVIETAGKGLFADCQTQTRPFRFLHTVENVGDQYIKSTADVDVEDLSTAVNLSEIILEETDTSNPNWSWVRDNSGIRFQHIDNVEHIDLAIGWARSTLLLNINQDIDRAESFDKIGELFLTRWRLRGEIEDIESAIEVEDSAQKLASHSCITKGKYLQKLETMLTEKFQATNQIRDLDRAIQVANECVELLTTNGDVSTRPTALHDLASCLRMRYEKTGNMEDMDNAIGALEKAVAFRKWDATQRQQSLEKLGLLWYLRYDRTQRNDDLDRAIQQFTLSMISGGTTEHRHLGYHYLGVCYHARYRSNGLSGDLFQAVEMAKVAVRLSSQDQRISKPSAYWFNLGSYMYQQFLFTTEWEDLQTAIGSFEEALRNPDLDPDEKCMILCQLGDSLVMRFGIKGIAKDLSKAEFVLREAFGTLEASLINRACAARSLANKLAYLERWEESLTAFRGATSLLATFNSELMEDKQPSIIESFFGLSRDAAAVALNAGETPLEALTLLERGRGLLSNSIPITTEISAKEVGTLRSTSSLFSYNADEIMSTISEDKLAVINVSKYGCDAILMEKGRIGVVPLTLLDHEVIDEKARILRIGGESSWGVLEWLWEVVAVPVLQGFKIYKPPTNGREGGSGLRDKGKSQGPREETPEDRLPHIWWITTGQLTQLPIHAAGKHFKSSGETVLDCVISSYAVSVKAFIQNRQDAVNRTCNFSRKALIASMPKTPGHPPLCFAEREASTVANICQSLNLNTETPDLPYGKDEILKQLQDCQIFHFAGHGLSDPTNPSQSCLLLHDWKRSPLTVESLQALNLHDNPPFLAYLSACSTGSNKVMTLCDESINLISASQLAGFRHVIGSLWEVNDRHCVSVAKIVYETIAEKGLTNFAVALGLHRANVRLRNEVVGKKYGLGDPNQSRREKDASSKLNSITVARLDDSEPCVVTDFPSWLNAELKSYRSTPLRQIKQPKFTKIFDTICSLPVEVMTVRQVPLESELNHLSRYFERNRSGLSKIATTAESEHEVDIPGEDDTLLRNPVKAKPKKPHLHWAPYVHFGI
ncbi:uncharacterized protein DFL_000556 [Arthrobotrys flagrans]|uniref:CHAT domain-containing protein n=1 Tax=Arthrobotrys flagrans TaxID=97331 RepID=A0A437AE37_ARTFL|nr:hypothetical protein DFL_000556 [Arthrobotrys flagrans]